MKKLLRRIMMVICIPISFVIALLRLIIWMPLEFAWTMHNTIYVSIIGFLFVDDKEKQAMIQAEKDLHKVLNDLKKKQEATETKLDDGTGA